jgi:GcrA cell cycle regulator
MQSTDWPSEHSEALREYHAKGMSYLQIAKAINASFNTRYSRNAVLGRSKRLGLGGFNGLADSSEPPSVDESSPKPAARVPYLGKPGERHATGFILLAPKFEAGTSKAPMRRHRAAAFGGDRPRIRRLPLSLWRRRRRRSHHLLRPPASQEFKLLRRAFSSDSPPRNRGGTRGPQDPLEICRRRMKHQLNPAPVQREPDRRSLFNP